MGRTKIHIYSHIEGVFLCLCFPYKLKKDKGKKLSIVKKGTVTEDLFLSAKEAL